ncbi:MAG: ketoacyl-ACP synthase III [Nitrospirae bacterium]|nr:ketoacyl-ACP synthase III [Nitrospirota bacterium]
MKAKIISTGSYLPHKRLTNQDLARMVDTSDEWITERTGIKERRIAEDSQSTSDLAYEASKIALRDVGLKPKEIDLIIVATATPDMFFPSTACFLQHRLHAKNVPAFDISAACSGFVYGLSVANSFIRSGQYKRILLVGAETLSKFTDWEDRTTCVLFGDGVGAVILEATTEESGIISTHLYSDGSYWDMLNLPAGGSRQPASKETLKKGQHYIKMKGNETFKIAVRTLESIVVETLKLNNLLPSDLSFLIPHQANLRIIQATADRLGLSMDKVIVNIEKYGNTSAASIPIALDEAVRAGKIKEGDYILLEAFGGGLTWASALIKW